MATNFYYVYALKDPRKGNAFYIGKGTGSRAYDHLVTPDKTRKYSRILEIEKAGIKPTVDILVDNISESEALRIEAELIAAFGTEDTGGLLTNSVVPTGYRDERRRNVVVPSGAVERAQIGLELIKSAILDLAKVNSGGITNADATSSLGLRSDHLGAQKNYLAYSVLGLLLREGKLRRDNKVYVSAL